MSIMRFQYNKKRYFGIQRKDKKIVAIDNFISQDENLSLDSILNLILLPTSKLLYFFEQAEKWTGKLYDIKDINISNPIGDEKKYIICLGKNYIEHAQEVDGKAPNLSGISSYPVYFIKRAASIMGNEDYIKLHSELTNGSVDYEVELAIIIGKEGANIAKDEAEKYIFGYTIMNDFSARNLQINHDQWFKGKSLNTHCSIGPSIIHKSELLLPLELDIKCYVNGELRQSSNTKNMIFNIPTIISNLSREMKLFPGDIISTGTPSGVGMGFSPPKYLQIDDVVKCSIQKIGSLINYVEE